MIAPDQIRARMFKLWAGQKIQKAHLREASLFPLDVPFAKPSAKTLSEKFAEVREWIRLLRDGSKQVVGRGYRVAYRRLGHRRLGEQEIPDKIIVDSLEDFLFLAGKEEAFRRFEDLSAKILSSWPDLRDFLCKNPSLVIDRADEWDRLLSVCRFFLDHPRPDLYLRQLDIPGVDTKFIEERRALLWDLLDVVLPPEAKTDGGHGLSDHGFERRFGLRFESPLVRFRLLDPAAPWPGMRDITLPLPEFQALCLPIQRVFLVENKVNGLCFPAFPGALVVFGLGYGINTLAGVTWFRDIDLHYWGDIDTHGFSILDQFRKIFPQTRSFLMDKETLWASRRLWGKEDPAQSFRGPLKHLTPDEKGLFESLLQGEWGIGLRLEQERIPFGLVQKKLESLMKVDKE